MFTKVCKHHVKFVFFVPILMHIFGFLRHSSNFRREHYNLMQLSAILPIISWNWTSRKKNKNLLWGRCTCHAYAKLWEPIDAQPDRAAVHRHDPGDGAREPDGVGPAEFFVPGIPLVGMPVFRYVISRTGTFQMFHHVPSQVFVEVRSEKMISLPLKISGNFCGIDWLPGIIWDLSQFRQD